MLITLLLGFPSSTDICNSIWATQLYFVECQCDQQMILLLITAFFNQILEICSFLLYRNKKKNLQKSSSRFAHYLQPRSYRISPLTKWCSPKPALPFVPGPPSTSTLPQGHCSSSFLLFTSLNFPTLLCHSHYHTNVLWSLPLKKKISGHYIFSLLVAPLLVSFTCVSNSHSPISQTHFVLIFTHSLHQNWSCEVTNGLITDK